MEAKSMKAVIVEVASLATIKTVEIPTPGDNEVLVKVYSTTINPSDSGFLAGYLFEPKFPTGIGFEGFGEVVAAGKGGENLIGQKVCFWSLQARAWAEYTTVPIRHLLTLPNETTVEEGTYAYLNPITCIGLFWQVKNEKHRGVIVTAGASQCGRMLTRIFKNEGYNVIAVVRNSDRNQICLDAGADVVLNSTDENFYENIRNHSENLKATVFIDCINGSFTANVLREMPFGSRAIVYGFLSGEPNINIDATQFFRKSSSLSCFFITFWLNTLSDTELEEVHRSARKYMTSLCKTELSQRFSLDQITDAINYYRENSHLGKVLITIS